MNVGEWDTVVNHLEYRQGRKAWYKCTSIYQKILLPAPSKVFWTSPGRRYCSRYETQLRVNLGRRSRCCTRGLRQYSKNWCHGNVTNDVSPELFTQRERAREQLPRQPIKDLCPRFPSYNTHLWLQVFFGKWLNINWWIDRFPLSSILQ